MKLRTTFILVILAVLIFSLKSYSQALTITITDTIYITKDALVSMDDPGSNFGEAETIENTITNGGQDNENVIRSYFEFDISSIPEDATINEALLYLFGLDHEGDNESFLQVVGNNWEENEISYDDQPELEEEYANLPASEDSEDNYEVDITDIVNYWHDDSYDNYGLILKIGEVELDEVNGLVFASSDFGDSEKHPYVIIEYEIEIPYTKLMAASCDITNVCMEQELYAEEVTLADNYIFKVFNTSLGFSEEITKSANHFNLSELNGFVNYNTQYNVLVKTIVGTDTSSFGDTCYVQTQTEDSIYTKGIVFVRSKYDYPGTLEEYDQSLGDTLNSTIPGFDAVAVNFQINKIEKVFKLIEDDFPELNNIYAVFFSECINADTVTAYFMNTGQVIYADKVAKTFITYWPSDPNVGSFYGSSLVNAEDAWTYVNANTPAYTPLIAVIDNGVQITHPELAQHLWTNPGETPGDSLDNDGNFLVDDDKGWDFSDNDRNVIPPIGTYHGSHVTSVLASYSDNSAGVASISFNTCEYLPIKVWSDNGTGTLYDMIRGINYAIKMDVDIISLSMGCSVNDQTLLSAVNAVQAKDILIVAAAANDGLELGVNAWVYPAMYNYVYCVGATDQNNGAYPDVKASFSNYGIYIDIMAPGGSMYGCNSNSSYIMMDGTSVATPMVASLAGLMKAYNPGMSASQIKNCINTTADDIYSVPGNSTYTGKLGNGRINAYDALMCAVNLYNSPPVADFTSNYQTICEGEDVWFSWTPDPSIASPTGYDWNFGDGSTYSGSNPGVSHAYTSAGVYSVTLTVTNANGSSSQTLNNYITVINSANYYFLDSKMDNQWYFGNNLDLDFNSGSPVFTGNSVATPHEAGSSIANSDGNLLFYAEDNKIYNRHHQVMQNGNLPAGTGHFSARNGVLIVPFPGDCANHSMYYVFFTPWNDPASATTPPDGNFNYLIVDMDGDNGLGEVVAGYPQTLISENFPTLRIREQQHATLHCEGDKIWVAISVYHEEWNFSSNIGDRMIAIELDGINPPNVHTPVTLTSATGTYCCPNATSNMMKFSPDGTKLAMTYYELWETPNTFLGCAILVMDFNKQTGDFQANYPPIIIPYAHSIEFSPNADFPNSGFIYYTTNATGELYQYDISTSTHTLLGDNYYQSAIQLGTDNKIYTSVLDTGFYILPGLPHLGVIQNPDNAGTGCNYTVMNNFFSSGGNSYSMPNTFISRITQHQSSTLSLNTDYYICPAGTLIIDVSNPNLSNYQWSGPAVTGTNIATITQPGHYIVTATDANGCLVQAETDVILDDPQASIYVDMSNICQDNILLDAGAVYSSYLWSPGGQTSSSIIVSSSGIYSVTVTTSNGCTDTASANIIIPPSLSIDSFTVVDETCINTSDGSVTVHPSGGTPPYISFWEDAWGSNVGVMPTISHLSQGTYYVTVTDVNGCTVTGSQVVNLLNNLNPAVALFTDTNSCFTIDSTTQYLDLSTDATAWNWTVTPGYITYQNGTNSSSQNPFVQYNDFGYYCITLEASNACGVDEISKTVYVQPENCLCQVDFDYDYETFNIGLPGVPGTTITWNNVYTTVEKDIIINEQCTLRILNNSTVKFGPQGRIIVKQGSKLELIESTLTTIDETDDLDLDCDFMWHGVEVWGEWSVGSYNVLQGTVQTDRARIENAHIGILSGKRDMDFICQGYNSSVNTPDGFVKSFSGGVVTGKGCDFRNCGYGIKYNPKQDPEAYENHLNGQVHTCSLLEDIHYNDTVLHHYRIPPNNYLYPWITKSNDYQRTYCGIWMENMELQWAVRENLFRNMDIGIAGFDAKFTVTDNHFRVNGIGIGLMNTTPSLTNNHEIFECTFDSIPGEQNTNGQGVAMWGTAFDKVHHNYFGLQTLVSDLNTTGIHTMLANRFTIYDNRFEFFDIGVRVQQSNSSGQPFASAYVGAKDPDWDGNWFTNCYYGIKSEYDNTWLYLRCNDHYNPFPALYTLNWDNHGLLMDQGISTTNLTAPNAHQYPAGNLFFDIAHRQIEDADTDNYDYIHHDFVNPLNNPYKPEDPAGNGNAVIQSVSAGSIIDVYFVNKDTSCILPLLLPTFPTPLPPITSYPFTKLDTLTLMMDTLEAEIDSINSLLDAGEISELIDSIRYGNSEGILVTMLVNSSPLPDEVLTVLINEGGLSDEKFAYVMERNLPVSEDLEPSFYVKLWTLDEQYIDQLKPLQVFNPDYTTAAALVKEKKWIGGQRSLLLNDLVITLTDSLNDRLPDAITLLENENTLEANMILASTYLEQGKYLDARKKLRRLPVGEPGVAGFKQLNLILLRLYSSGLTIYDMDSTDRQFVYNLAYDCPPVMAVAGARTIVKLLYDEDVPDCPLDMGERSALAFFGDVSPDKWQPTENDDMMLGDNYPDPFEGRTTIPYKLLSNTKGIISIWTKDGKLMAQYNINSDNTKLEVNTRGWSPGVYFYNMEVNGTVIAVKKMVIGR